MAQASAPTVAHARKIHSVLNGRSRTRRSRVEPRVFVDKFAGCLQCGKASHARLPAPERTHMITCAAFMVNSCRLQRGELRWQRSRVGWLGTN